MGCVAGYIHRVTVANDLDYQTGNSPEHVTERQDTEKHLWHDVETISYAGKSEPISSWRHYYEYFLQYHNGDVY